MYIYIKGYDFTLLNRRKLKKLRVSSALQVDTDLLKEQMLEVLKKNGRIYALFHQKELVACYLFAKRTADDSFLREEDRGCVQKTAPLTVYELTHCYHASEASVDWDMVEKAFLQDLREYSLLQGVDAILWGERYFLPQWWEDNTESGMLTGLALGLLFGLITNHLLLGLLIGLALPPLFGWGRHHKKSETEEEISCH